MEQQCDNNVTTFNMGHCDNCYNNMNPGFSKQTGRYKAVEDRMEPGTAHGWGPISQWLMVLGLVPDKLRDGVINLCAS